LKSLKVKFLLDSNTGRAVAEWLRQQGHDVFEARLEPDPGDTELLERAANEGRILITIDTDFGELIFRQRMRHAGLVRLPDVPGAKRVEIMKDLLERYRMKVEQGAILTVRGGRIRVSRSEDLLSDD
jgi:predicted nuclease of predicted toxin-antitoxin system